MEEREGVRGGQPPAGDGCWRRTAADSAGGGNHWLWWWWWFGVVREGDGGRGRVKSGYGR